MRIIYLTFLCLFVVTNSHSAQTCKPESIPASTSHFVDNGDGTISDQKTGLMWKKCVEGLSGSLCTSGEYESFSYWKDAWEYYATIAGNTGTAGYSDWRLPNIKELLSTMENQCSAPALNLSFLPTPYGNGQMYLWSNSPNIEIPSNIWVVNYTHGSSSRLYSTGQGLLRLVRDEQ